MDIVRLDTLMRDNLVCLVILMNIFFLYAYADVIMDITSQLITLNQGSKSDKYHKNKHSSIQIFTKIVLVFFCSKNRSPIPKGHFRHKISKYEIHICLKKEKVRIIRVKRKEMRKD
jgi:hypothetical protein